MERYSLGSTARLHLSIITAGVGIISQIATTAVMRVSDLKWFEASTGNWVSTKVENPMVETDSVNLPGQYHFDFNQALDTLAGSNEYIARKSSSTLALEYENLTFGALLRVTTPELCSVQGTIFNSQGTPRENVLVRATLEPVLTDGLGRAFEADSSVTTYSNELGDFDLPLVRGGIFRLEISAVGYNRRVTIPDSASVLFSAL